MKNGTLFGFLLCLIALWPTAICAENSTNHPAQMLQKLDESLTKKAQYEQQKLQRIAQLKAQLPRTFDRKRYVLLRQLYKEYASYQYDSAYTYALQMNQMAKQLHSQDFHIEAQCAQVFCLLSALLTLANTLLRVPFLPTRCSTICRETAMNGSTLQPCKP